MAALGVWLPIALADIMGWVAAGATMGAKIIRREDALNGWHLPELAKAVLHDAEESEQDELTDGCEWLERTYGKAN